MENEKMKDTTADFAQLISKGFKGTPFSAEDNVELAWDLDKATHETVLSIIKMMLRGNMINSPMSDEGQDKLEVAYDQLKLLKETGGRYTGPIKCECAGVFCLISLFLGLYDGSITDNEGNDVLSNKEELIKFCTGLFSKLKKV